MEEKTKMGEEFEKKILAFVKKMGLEEADTRINFGTDEIDVVGGWKNILFLIECRWKSKKKTYNLKTDIKSIKGQIDSVLKGTRNHRVYSKYSKYKFVLATKNCAYREVDKEYAKAGPENRRVYLWDEGLVDYYTDLVKTLKDYAKFSLFAEVEIRPVEEIPVFRIPAFFNKEGRYETFLFFATPKELLKYCYVARRERGETQYYQRLIKKDRIQKIAKYIDEGGFFPNNIIASINDRCQFFSSGSSLDFNDVKLGILQFPKNYRSLWIIDGQHRLLAYAKTKKSMTKLPVLAFKKLETHEQTKFFIDINENQKSVDPNLIWDLHGEMRPNQEEGIISNAVKRLNEGALKDKIYIPFFGKLSENRVNLSALCIALKRCGLARQRSRSSKERKNYLFSKNPKKTTKNLNTELDRFFSVINDLFSSRNINNFILTNGGIAIVIYVYERLLAIFGDVPNENKLRKYLQPLNKFLEDIEISDYIDRSTSEGGRMGVLEEVINRIAHETKDSKLLSTVQIPKISEKLAKLERDMSFFIDRIFLKRSTNWYKEMIPKALTDRLRDRLEKKLFSDKREKLHEFLTFGEIKEVMNNRQDNRKIFKDIFTQKDIFTSWEEFIGAFDRLFKYRNPSHHGAHLEINSETLKLIEAYIKRVYDCIKRYLKK